MQSRFEKRTLYIQENAGFYLNKFGIMESTGSKVSWNWCAFFFTSAWMLYRKMYRYAAGLMIIEFLLLPFLTSIIEDALFFSLFSSGINLVLGCGINILMGLFGNYLYMGHIDHLMDSEPAADAFGYQQKYGGGSWKLVGIYLIISMVISSVLENLL